MTPDFSYFPKATRQEQNALVRGLPWPVFHSSRRPGAMKNAHGAMKNGPWAMKNGSGAMKNGLWAMKNGPWAMKNGPGAMKNGACPGPFFIAPGGLGL